MKLSVSSVIATALLVASPAAAAYKGFNLGANMPGGACKTTQNWKDDLAKIKSWPNGFNAIRLFTSSDCNALDQAIPAAQAYGFKILVGVWASPDEHYNLEKSAFDQALAKYGTGWIAAVSVGSEDLYRNTQTGMLKTDPNHLATLINQVRTSLRGKGGSQPVGHTDTWTAWVDPANNIVTQNSDIAIVDGYPYWQGTQINSGKAVFYKSIADVTNYIASINRRIPVWVGETGWPTGGDAFGAATTGGYNAQKYWKTVGCSLVRNGANFFWYSAFDAPDASNDRGGVEKHFGVAYPGRTLKFKLNC